MKKKLSLRFLFVLSIVALLPNFSSAQSVSYKVIEDDPDLARPVQIHLIPFYMEMWGTNLVTMGWETWANVNYKKALSFYGGFRSAYFDINTAMGDKSLSKYWNAEASAQYNLSSKLKKKSLKIVLSSSSYSSGGYTYTNTKFIMVPGTVRKIFGVRGGIYNYNSSVKTGDMKVKSQTGTSVSGKEEIPFYAINKDDPKDTIHNLNGSTMINSFGISAGISLRSITNLIVSTDGWGNRSNSITNDIYLEALITPTIHLSDINATSTLDQKSHTYDVYATAKKYMGWKFGWQFYKTKSTFMSYKMEFGSRPGLRGGIFGTGFFNFSVGLNIPVKVKALMVNN